MQSKYVELDLFFEDTLTPISIQRHPGHKFEYTNAQFQAQEEEAELQVDLQRQAV